MRKLFKAELDIGHILTVLTVIGAFIGMWKSNEVRAAEILVITNQHAKQIQQLEQAKENDRAYIQNMALTLERISTIIDQHIKAIVK